MEMDEEMINWKTFQSSEWIPYLLLLDQFDILSIPSLYPSFIAYIKQSGINVNACPSALQRMDQSQPVLPFVLSFPFSLVTLIRLGKAEEAVKTWKEVMCCETDFVMGMYVE